MVDEIVEQPVPARQYQALQIEMRHRRGARCCALRQHLFRMCERQLDAFGDLRLIEEIDGNAVFAIAQHLHDRWRVGPDDHTATGHGLEQ